MLSRDRQAKKNARLALKGVWGRAVGCLILIFAVSLAAVVLESALALWLGIDGFADTHATPQIYYDDTPSTALPALLLPAGVALGALLLLAPLRLGVKNWYYLRTYGHEPGGRALGFFFSTPRLWARALALEVRVAAGGLFYFALCSAPGAVLLQLNRRHFAPYTSSGGEAIAVTMGYLLGWLTVAAGLACFYIVVQRYAAAGYALCRSPELSARQAVRLSRHAMRGHMEAYTVFRLSFAGWWLAGMFIVPLLYAAPYYHMAQALYARYYLELAGNTPEGGELTPVQVYGAGY